jgi:hypothetical protein
MTAAQLSTKVFERWCDWVVSTTHRMLDDRRAILDDLEHVLV